LKNQGLDVHMHAPTGPLKSARTFATVSSPIGVRVTTSIDRQIAQELGIRDEQVAAAVALLEACRREGRAVV
jgi:hypothetical protein